MNVKDKAKQEHEANIELMQDLKNRLDAVENKTISTTPDHPNPTKHKYISFVKSAFRIAAGIALVWPQSIVVAGILLIIAEVLGVAEELV
jgi:hypothetical protein